MKSRKLSDFWPNDLWFDLGLVIIRGEFWFFLWLTLSFTLATPIAHLTYHPEVGMMSSEFFRFVLLAAILVLCAFMVVAIGIATYMDEKYRDHGKPRQEVHIECPD